MLRAPSRYFIRRRAALRDCFFAPEVSFRIRILVLWVHPGLNIVGRRVSLGTSFELYSCQARGQPLSQGWTTLQPKNLPLERLS